MTHTIKLDDATYRALESIRQKRETFSETVARLIRAYAAIVQATRQPAQQEEEQRER